ncbi:MAG TPA: thioredoxin domain-containing protein [Pyrinomonadaceae bacterium]|nr:thioredoxin domain-containing protein [Pyrinomonadaceae bacterium]
MKKSLPFIIIILVLVAGVAAFVIFSRQRGAGNANTFANAQPQPTAASQAASQSSPGNATGYTRPNVKVSSPVVLEEYGDYQCPPCGILHPVLKQIEHEYGDQVRFVFRHFPLTKIHKNAMMAAQAAEAAGNQGKFKQMHDRLYGTQNGWKDLSDARPTFIGYARELGLNVEQFTRDMDSSAVQQRIASDMQKGSGVGVSGTPTVFIDGQMLRYEATTPEGLRQGINYMLQRKASGQ